jgi:hypothetical protein
MNIRSHQTIRMLYSRESASRRRTRNHRGSHDELAESNWVKGALLVLGKFKNTVKCWSRQSSEEILYSCPVQSAAQCSRPSETKLYSHDKRAACSLAFC